MQAKLLASVALFSILSLAQINNIDQNLVSRISADAAAIQANPTWISAVNAVASAAPASVLAAAGNNPSVLFNQIASATTIPSWYSNIPTSVVGSFATLVAPAIIANADFDAYIASVAAQPAGSSLLNAVYSAAPASVQSAYSTNQLGLAAAVVASTPAWAANIPLPVQTSLAAVYNSALHIEASDLEISRTASRTGAASYTRPSSGAGLPYGTGKPSGLPPFATGRPSTCPACPACTPVTVYTTVTALPSASSASISSVSSASSVSAASKPSSSSVVASTGFPKPTATASTGFPKPSISGLPSGVKTTPSGSVVAFSSKTASGSVVAFTGGAAPGMGKGAAGLVAVVVAGVGGLLVG